MRLGIYRNRLDIVADILNVVSWKAKKTQIMYGANLSYKVLQRYLATVVETSLVSFDSAQNYYVLTPKGKEFLMAYRAYSRNNKNVEKRLDDICDQKKFLDGLCSKRQTSQ
jgi:predicted transcriptional regulator